MPSQLRSDSDDELGRGRSATYPPRPSRRASEYSIDRDDWCPKGLESRRHTSPVGLFYGKGGRGSSSASSLLKKPDCLGRSLKKKWHSRGEAERGHNNTSPFCSTKAKYTSPIPTSCESASGTSRSGGGGGLASRGARRRYRKGWEDSSSSTPTRQQRLVTAMFGLVVVLASIQIIALVVHPPREDRLNATGGLGVASIAGAGVGDGGGGGGGNGSGVRRRTAGGGGGSGLRDSFTRSGGDGASAGGGGGGGRGDVGEGFNGSGSQQQQKHQQQQGLSLSNPRAFEMVAADMGHLKDTVEKLDLAFRETMGRQGKDLAAVVDQLGLRSAESLQASAKRPPNASVEQPFGKPKGNGDEKFPPAASDPAGKNSPNKDLAPGNNGAVQYQQLQGKQGHATADFQGSEKSEGGGAGGGAEGGGLWSQVGDGGGGGGEKPAQGGESVVWNAYSRGKWVNGQWVPKVLADDTSPDLSDLVENQRRVLLLSERRSGGHAVGGILNADPRVFYVGDPCRMGGGPEALDGRACSLALSRLLACQPTVNDIRNLYSFSYIVGRSRALSEFEDLRWQVGGSPEDNDGMVRDKLVQQCRLSKAIVIKETRLPEVTPQLTTEELGTEFLHIVRDPRAAVHGLAEGWEGSKSNYNLAMAEDCTELASRMCRTTEKKLAKLTELGKQRFRVLKYEMVIEAPFAMVKSVYNWLALGQLPQEVTDTITSLSATGKPDSPPSMTVMDKPRTSVGRFEWATRWAAEMPAFRRQQVQYACQPLLVALGYDEPESVDPSSEQLPIGDSDASGASDAFEASSGASGTSTASGDGNPGNEAAFSSDDGENGRVYLPAPAPNAAAAATVPAHAAAAATTPAAAAAAGAPAAAADGKTPRGGAGEIDTVVQGAEKVGTETES